MKMIIFLGRILAYVVIVVQYSSKLNSQGLITIPPTLQCLQYLILHMHISDLSA